VHRFVCYPQENQPLPALAGAHAVGTDNVPLRADLEIVGNEIRCTTRSQEPIGLSLLWPVEGFGVVQLQTARLPGRDAPYHLPLELARHQMMRVSVKREEWGLYDYGGMDEVAAQIDEARDAFVRALQTIDRPEEAAQHANKALAAGLVAGEAMSHFHANVFLGRRHQTGGFAKPFLGACIPAGLSDANLCKQIADLFDFVRVPCNWREIEPTEQDQRYDAIEASMKACAQSGMTLHSGPLLNFGVRSVPDWMYIWEHDFESIYEAARKHVERTVQRYAKQVQTWIAVSGLHADNVFGFSFEQVMELTRMAVTTIKRVAPRAQVLIDLSQPWGEYYARNQQTIPPLLYADMAVQSGINFDGFGLQFLFGVGSEDYHLRDVLQISALIDKLANLGKMLHITALGAPSATGPTPAGGEWRAPWSESVQADWLSAVATIALSKPYVDTVCLVPLTDGPDSIIADGGLLRTDHAPKSAFAKLLEMRKRFVAGDVA
jgi:hypothetical protein